MDLVWYGSLVQGIHVNLFVAYFNINGEESHILFYFFFFKLGRTEEQRKAVENC